MESSEIMKECKDKEQEFYILNCAPEKQHKNIPHIKDEWFIMLHPLLGSLIIVPPSYERREKIDVRLGVKFISSRWRKNLIGSFRDTKSGAALESTQVKVGFHFSIYFTSFFIFVESQVDGKSEYQKI